jgi:hypothetical protein
MNQLLLQVVIVVACGAFCFGCGYSRLPTLAAELVAKGSM